MIMKKKKFLPEISCCLYLQNNMILVHKDTIVYLFSVRLTGRPKHANWPVLSPNADAPPPLLIMKPSPKINIDNHIYYYIYSFI